MSQRGDVSAAGAELNGGRGRGAVDLSGLSSGNQTPTGQPAGGQGASGGSYVVEVTTANFNQIAQQSTQYPVLLELYSPRDPNGAQVSQVLVEQTNAAQGRWLLGRINADTEPQIAATLQAQAVPYVLLLVAGQAAPLFQGTRDRAEIVGMLDQIAQVAVASGLTGRAPAQAPATDGADDQAEPAAPVDTRFEAADKALADGDYARAVEEFDALLAQSPNDPEVRAGRAQAALLQRSTEFDPAVIVRDAAARPDDVPTQLAAADLEMIQGQSADALDRLLGLLASLDAESREPVRLRILELFTMLDPADPVVLKARRRLTSALF